MHGHAHGAGWSPGQWILLLPFAAATLIYVAAAVAENSKGRPWPWWRTGCWVLGLGIASLAISADALAMPARPFTEHAIRHLLIGMVAPLLLVLAAPITLALRSFAVLPARRLSRALRSRPVRAVANPVVAAVLNVGSLWMLYFTPLYGNAAGPFLHVAVMIHFLAAGFLFTSVIVCVDPSPHRASVGLRLSVLTLALAAHGILAKALYASAEDSTGAVAGLVQVTGISAVDLHTGAQIMFYGGDLVDLTLIVLVLSGWYRTSGRRLHERRKRMKDGPVTARTAAPAPESKAGRR